MRILWISLFVSLSLFLGGCGYFKADQAGGSVTTTFSDITQTLDPETKQVVTTDKSVTVTTQQPENPDSPGKISMTRDKDGVSIQATTGTGQNLANAAAKFGLLEIITWAGIGLTVLGVIWAVLSKKIFMSSWPGVALAGTGVAMTILAVLLAEFALQILIGVGIIVTGLVLYLCYHFLVVAKTADDVVTTNQLAMQQGIIKEEEYKNLSRQAQVTSTSKMVKKIKGL